MSEEAAVESDIEKKGGDDAMSQSDGSLLSPPPAAEVVDEEFDAEPESVVPEDEVEPPVSEIDTDSTRQEITDNAEDTQVDTKDAKEKDE